MKFLFSNIIASLFVAAVSPDDNEPPNQHKIPELNFEDLNSILSHPNFNSSGMYLPDVSFSFKFNRTNSAFLNESSHFFNETEDGKKVLNHRMVEKHLEKFLNKQLNRKQNQFVLDHYKNMSANAIQNQTAQIMKRLKAMKTEEEKKMIEKMEMEDRQVVPYSNIYIPNPRVLFDDRYLSDEKVVRTNIEWLEQIHYNPGQDKFIEKMINTPETVAFIPYFAATQIDPTPYCWILLFYNSDIQEGRKDTLALLNGLSKYYYERCGVSQVDLAYPTNAAIFASLKNENLPMVLVKKPLTANKMFLPESLKIRPTGRAEGNFKLSPIETWAEAFHFNDLVDNPIDTFKKISNIYEESPPNVKIAALLMEHYHELDKHVLETFFGDMLTEVRKEAGKNVHAQGMKMSYSTEGREKMTPAEIEAHDLKYAQKFAEEMQKVYENEKTISFQVLLHNALHLAVANNPSLPIRTDLNPISHPDVHKTFHDWIHNEL